MGEVLGLGRRLGDDVRMHHPDSAIRLRFDLARPTQAAEIVALVESAYRGASSRLGWTTEADLLDGQRTDLAAILDELADPKRRLLLVRDGDELVACARLLSTPPEAQFGLFAVRPERQGQGIGRALLVETERRARDEFGARRMVMEVLWMRRELIAWYGRLGYRATGEQRPFPYGNERFGRPRRPDLYFIVLAKDLED